MNRNAMQKDDGKSQRKLVKVKLTRDSIVRDFRGVLRAGTILRDLTEVRAEELVRAGTATLYETKVIHPELKQGAAVVSVVNETPPPQPLGALTFPELIVATCAHRQEPKTDRPRGDSRRSGGKRKG